MNPAVENYPPSATKIRFDDLPPAWQAARLKEYVDHHISLAQENLGEFGKAIDDGDLTPWRRKSPYAHGFPCISQIPYINCMKALQAIWLASLKAPETLSANERVLARHFHSLITKWAAEEADLAIEEEEAAR